MVALSSNFLWLTTISASDGIVSTDELITVMFEAKFFILFLNFVAPIALEPIPASQANTILLITSLLITTS